MTTTPVKEEALEQIAERIVELAQHSIVDGEVKQAVLSALRNERKRAVNIARGEDCGLSDCLCAARIAAAIRGRE